MELVLVVIAGWIVIWDYLRLQKFKKPERKSMGYYSGIRKKRSRQPKKRKLIFK